MRSKIIIPSSGIIEMYDDDNISLTYQVADIKDPQKRHADFSKTITVPGTHNNNKMFQGIFSLGIDRYFDPNKKAACIVTIDQWSVMKGYMRLKNIKKVDTKIDYEIEITGRYADLFTAMGDTYVKDLPWADLNHTWDRPTQIASWGATIGSGYVYPFIDYGKTLNDVNYGADSFFPALYVKEIWDRIFSYFGFQYTSTSSFFTSSPFKNLIMPYTSDNMRLTDAQISLRKFRASRTLTNQTLTATSSLTAYTNEAIVFNDDSTAPNEDTGATYATSTGRWTCPNSGLYSFSTFLKGGVKSTTGGGGDYINHNYSTYGAIYNITQGSYIYADSAITTGNAGTGIQSTQTANFQHFLNTSAPVYVSAGDVVEVRLYNKRVQVHNYTSLTSYSILIYAGSFFFNKVDPILPVGSTVTMANTIDQKLKCKDFVNSIVKMFNLYTEYDKDTPNKLIIDPRNSFYTSTVVDWTQKRDLNRELEIMPMGALNARQYIFKYKSDNDWLNELYTKETGESYGQKRLIVDNDFLVNTETEEVSFSNSPLDSTSATTTQVPFVSSDDRYFIRLVTVDANGLKKPKTGNPRILYYGGVKGCKPWTYSLLVSGPNIPSSGVTNYPYAGHLDDPINPTLDLCWDFPIKVYYDPTFTSTYTDNNLYNAYWKQEIDEVTNKNSSIVTGWFKLTPYDISILDFRHIYRFDLQNFRLNKVYDYNPLKDGFTKCEFIKVKNGVPFTATNSLPMTGGFHNTSGPAGGGLHLTRFGNSAGHNTNVNTNHILGTGNVVASSAQRVFISGDNNVVGDEAFNVNIINSSGCVVPGNVGEVVIINSSGVTVTDSNKMVVNNMDIKSQRNFVRRVTTNYEITDDDYFIEIANDLDITLPNASLEKNRGRTLSFKYTGSDYRPGININPILSQTIDNGTAINFYPLSSREIISDGANWKVITSSERYLVQAVYTPTGTIDANCDTITMYTAQYIIVGNGVTVSGRFSVDPTLNTTATYFRMSLPIASNFSQPYQCAGTCVAPTIAGTCASISADATNNEALVYFISSFTADTIFYFHYTYQIL